MTIAELLERRLIFIAGKGGVGKSTISAALALVAARKGYPTCIVESDSQEQMSQLFQTKPLGYKGATLAPNLRGVSISTSGALREFAQTRLPLHNISKMLIDNRLTRYFLDATPGLKELLTLGKIVDIVRDSDDEHIIVDLPATGHSMAMLDVPNVVMEAVHAGPLRRHAEEIHAVINDPALSAICFVALAEELSTTETIEAHGIVKRKLNIAVGPVIANGVHEELFNPKDREKYETIKRRWLKDKSTASLIEGAELTMSRIALNKRYIERLTEEFDQPPVTVRFHFVEAIDRDILTQISDELYSGSGQ